MDEDEQIIDTPLDEDDLDDDYQQYRTYRMDFEHKRISGFVDGIEACAQAIWKILSTTRFAHLIYDDQYGNDLFNKLNDSDLTPEYLAADIPVMIEDALTADERILSVSDLEYEIVDQDSVHVKFTVETIYGDTEIEGVLNDGD